MVSFHPITVATRSLDSVPLLCQVATLYSWPHSWTVVISRGIPSSSPIAFSPSNSAADLFCAPYKSKRSCSNHHRYTHAPSLQVDRSQRSIIRRVAIYCATVLCLLVMYVPNSSKPASTISSSKYGYSQLQSPRLSGCLQVSRWATLCQKLLRSRSILGVNTHVSAPNNNTTCVTAFKNAPTPPV